LGERPAAVGSFGQFHPFVEDPPVYVNIEASDTSQGGETASTKSRRADFELRALCYE
jgi:hypothetical protein